VLPFTVAGLAHAESGERFAVMDIAAAQDAFARGGRLSRIDIGHVLGWRSTRCAHASRHRCRRAWRSRRRKTTWSMAIRLSRAYRVNLNVLALVALFTGRAPVFTTQALSVVRRRPQFALLRTLGMTRGRLASLLVVEGALVGVAGSIIGLLAGTALAFAVMRVVGADLGAGYLSRRGAAARRRRGRSPRVRRNRFSWRRSAATSRARGCAERNPLRR
jgi:putative ABC transport system permease protein